jgi:signal transduction histidine kinase
MIMRINQNIRQWQERSRLHQEKLFDDWLLNDTLQDAWRTRILATLSLIFTFFAVLNGGLALKTYFDFPEHQVWQYKLLIASSWYWGIFMLVGWWLARREQAQITVYIMLILFLIGPTGLGGIGIKGFGVFYNIPLLVLSIIFVSLLSKPEKQQRLIVIVVVVWSGFILFQYLFDEIIRTPIPPLMKVIGPGALASTVIFYIILFFQFYRLSVPNKILMSFLTGLQVVHQAIMTFMGSRLVTYMSYPAFVEFMQEFQYLFYFLIGAMTLAMLYITRTISNPLTHLTTTAIRVKEGDLKVRADFSTIDEIGELAKVFNQVISRLSATLDGLEHTVEDRTRELHVAVQELKRVDNLKNQFLASMSHELRTPLNAIINYVAIVADGMMGDINAEQKDLLDGAVKSSRHLLHLINDLLDISKIQAGKLALYVENGVDVRNELEASLNIASAMILDKPLQIVKEMDNHLPLISGDKRRIRQIVLNLLSNAIKFTDEGTITLQAKRSGDEIIISVIDSGPGISYAAQSLIFEPFTQTEDGIKLEGTGLGLPISRTLAQLHGGRLWVESEPGAGAAFHFALPTGRSA